jgi:hypothetical protein
LPFISRQETNLAHAKIRIQRIEPMQAISAGLPMNQSIGSFFSKKNFFFTEYLGFSYATSRLYWLFNQLRTTP